MKRQKLSVYRLKDMSQGFTLKSYKEVIGEGIEIKEYSLRKKFPFNARLFVSPPSTSTPEWVEFLEPGFGQLSENPETTSLSAVLIIQLDKKKGIYYAFTFGFGRYLLKPTVILEKFGLRVALNSIYTESAAQVLEPTDRIRKIVAKTVSENTLHTIKQSNRGTNFESFGVDVNRDILRSITGRPVDTEGWGTIISGANAASINPTTSFNELGNICESLEELHGSQAYKEHFSWVDNVDVITDSSTIEKLQEALISILVHGPHDKLQLAPPEIIDWDLIADFRFSLDDDTRFYDLEIDHYLEVLVNRNELADLTIEDLKDTKVIGTPKDGGQEQSWTIYQCINGEIEYEGKTILIDDGEFYEIANGFIEKLDKFIESLQELDAKLVMPNSIIREVDGKSKEMEEEEYNQLAANSNNSYLLLDRKTVNLGNRTTAVEICDILTTDGHFIHIKRKLTSSSLSHLFSQGYVSGELLVLSQEYRTEVIEKIKEVIGQLSDEETPVGAKRDFQALVRNERPQPQRYEIVYAIIADWDLARPGGLVERLPFFSKVNLRSFAETLVALGYRVTYKRIGLTAEPRNQD